MIQANKEDFIFRQWNCTMNVLHPSLSKSFALNICSKDPVKSSTLGYFCKITYSQMHRKFQPRCLFGRWCVPFFDLNFLSLHYATCFFRQILQTFTEKLQTFTEGLCKLEKYAFLWFKKRDFYFWWEENTS